jgi:hypothetical protein
VYEAAYTYYTPLSGVEGLIHLTYTAGERAQHTPTHPQRVRGRSIRRLGLVLALVLLLVLVVSSMKTSASARTSSH